MNEEQIHNELIKQWNFSKHGLFYQALSRPNLAAKVIFNRIKYRLTGSPTIENIKLFFGEKMQIKFPEQVSEMLSVHHFYEISLTTMILSYLKPGMTFVDIGAHYGYFTLLAFHVLKGNGMIYSFEPTKSTYEVLIKNTQEKKNIQAKNLAAWSHDTELELLDYGDIFAGCNSFTKPRNKTITINDGKRFKINAAALDNFFKNNFPDFVKIDAESAELEILKGMNKIINEKHPIITIEVGDLIEGLPKSRIVVDYMMDRNYKAFEFKNGKVIPHKILKKYQFDTLLFLKN